MIETWSSGRADDCMPEAMLTSVLQKVRHHPWWKARTRLALEILRRNSVLPPAVVFDVGCGWGVTIEALEHAGYRVTGLDISPEILRLIDKPERRLIEMDLSQPIVREQETADAILSLDVIEHIDDDRGALARMSQFLKPGGVCIVSVPATPDLFSDFDRIQGHRRRYLPDTLRAAFADTGLAVKEIFFWGAWMVPVLRAQRCRTNSVAATPRSYADYLTLPPWPGPLFMAMAHSLEQPLALRHCLNTGTSLFAVSVKE